MRESLLWVTLGERCAVSLCGHLPPFPPLARLQRGCRLQPLSSLGGALGLIGAALASLALPGRSLREA